MTKLQTCKKHRFRLETAGEIWYWFTCRVCGAICSTDRRELMLSIVMGLPIRDCTLREWGEKGIEQVSYISIGG